MHSYADDSQLYVHAPADEVRGCTAKLTACIADIDAWMTSNRLKLNADKTQFIYLGSRQQLVKIAGSVVNLNTTQIKLSDDVTCLGVVVDRELTFAAHTRRLAARCFYQLRQLRVVRRMLSTEAAKTLVHAFIVSRIDYCNSVLAGVSGVHLNKLQSVMNAAARLIANKRKFDHISATLRDDLHWLPIRQRIDYKVSLIAFKSQREGAPVYLADLCQPVASVPGRRNLRSASHGDLVVLKTRTKTFGPRSFAVNGPVCWNKLPLTVRDPTLSIMQFRHLLKPILFRIAYPRDP